MDVPRDASYQALPDQARGLQQSTLNGGTAKRDGDDPLRTYASNRMQLKQVGDMTLQFLSTCSNESLLFVIVGLMGSTYIILGRLGLLFIGTALGVVLHSSWESGDHNSSEARSSRGKQLSLDIVQKLLEWDKFNQVETGQTHKTPGSIGVESDSKTEVDISSLPPITATALHSLIDAAVRDYVNYWYEPILPSETTFPSSCRKVLTGFITSVSSHLYRKRTADTFLEFLTNSSSMVIVFLNELCSVFEAAGHGVTAEDAVLQYLRSNPESSLSSLLAQQQQRQKLKTVSDDILSRFLESSAYNCIPVRNFLREVLSSIVLESTIQSMSRPEFINGWITYLFSEGESEIMSAIDAGVEGARNHGIAAVKAPGEITPSASVSTDESIAKHDTPPQVPSYPSTKVDQATEDAILEAKRLSDLMAAENAPRNNERTIRDNLYDHDDLDYGDNTIADAGVEIPVEEGPIQEESLLKTESAEGAMGIQGVKLSEQSGSPTSPSLQSSSVPLNSPSNSLDVPPTLTLYRASITVDDSLDSGSQEALRSKPTSDYLIQVEPHSGRSSGWMVFKRYADFEAIHDTLETIARLNQLRFGDTRSPVPPWKGRTRQALAHDLQQYLQDALQLEPLADSVTMRRFLEKDGAFGSEMADSSIKSGFVFPGQAAFENVSKGVLGVLTNAPKGVSGGGKAVLDGVSGVFGGGINKKTPVARGTDGDGRRNSSLQQNTLWWNGDGSDDERTAGSASDTKDNTVSSRPLGSGDMDGPVSPSEIASLAASSTNPVPTPQSEVGSDDRAPFASSSMHKSNASAVSVGLPEERGSADLLGRRKDQSDSITADETRMAVELIFAVINELYTLSSAWSIRRTLLNAAKSYILRPGNPSLETIRGLLQESMIDSNTTDEVVGMYLAKLRENVLPTAEELSSWPPPSSDAEKERQREAARRILVQKGLPQAITSVMGAVASREALGKVFDSLQVEIVAKGFVFSILLQALRAVLL
ncbi:PX domain protein [Aspergillus undulatus]|uniref:PX domain protein n=1 Tax=Aspergillus undulatus TaxID=1810928 RepID=UPI003CCD78D0